MTGKPSQDMLEGKLRNECETKLTEPAHTLCEKQGITEIASEESKNQWGKAIRQCTAGHKRNNEYKDEYKDETEAKHPVTCL